MLHLTWQKSSFSGDESGNCLYLAAVPDGTLRLRESDAPGEVIATTPVLLGHLIRTLKTGALVGPTRADR